MCVCNYVLCFLSNQPYEWREEGGGGVGGGQAGGGGGGGWNTSVSSVLGLLS